MAKPKSKQEEALQFLDDLDSLSPAPAAGPGKAPGRPTNEGETAEVLAFLDEITQKSSEPTRLTTTSHIDRPLSRAGTPTLRKSTERVKVGAPASQARGSGSASSTPPPSAATPDTAAASQAAKGWGWGNVWSSASVAIQQAQTVVQQARTVVDEQVKSLPANEQAKKWSEGAFAYAKSAQEYAKTAQLDRLGIVASLRIVVPSS